MIYDTQWTLEYAAEVQQGGREGHYWASKPNRCTVKWVYLRNRSESVACAGIFFRGVQQIQLRIEGRGWGSGGGPLVRGSTQFANE
jgi:hypothetical protein